MHRRLLQLPALLLPLVASAPTAQTFPTDDPVLRRIWSLGMDSSQTGPLAQVLLDSIGPRLTGTPGHRRANDWLVRTYASWGIEAENERVGTWRAWRRGHSHIDLVAPRVRTLEGTMLAHSPGTGGKPLTATTVILPRFADSVAFVRWLPAVRGKLVLISAPQPTCRPRASWAQHATPTSRAQMDSLRDSLAREWGGRNVRGTGHAVSLGGGELGLRLEKAGAAGIVTSRPKDAWGTIEVFETYTTRAPAIALSCEDYGLVFRLTERNQGPRLRLDLDAQLMGEQPIHNTIATIRGGEKPDEYVLLSAHFDSYDAASGATDNGTGTLTMMEAMRILKQVYPRPKRTILAGHWTAEEHGLVGSTAFTEDHPEVLRGLQALFNQDNGTGRIVRTGAAGLPDAAAHLRRWLNALPAELGRQVSFGGVGLPSSGGSDDAPFSCHGLPTFGLGALSWDYSAYTWHTNRDTYDKVVFDDLKSNATLTAMLAYLASEDPSLVTRERVDLAALAAQRRQAAASLAAQRDSVTAADSARAARTGPPAAAAGRGGRRIPEKWPECSKAPRTTRARLR